MSDITIREVAESLAKYRNLVFNSKDQSYYVYSSNKGIYVRQDDVQMQKLISDFIDNTDEFDIEWELQNINSIFSHTKLLVPYADNLGADKEHIVMKNGVYDLKTNTLLKHSSKYRAITALDFSYDETATCERFDQYVSEVSNSKAMEKTLYEVLGVAIAGEISHNRIILCNGLGNNGKSIFLSILTKLVGITNVTHTPISVINGTNAFARYELASSRLNVLHELENGITLEKLFDANVKKAICSEPLDAEIKYGARFTFEPMFNIIIATNHLPEIGKEIPNKAIKRRYLILNWTRIFTEEEQDRNLKSKLYKELPGIFNKAMIALHELRQQDFRFSVQDESDAFLQRKVEECFPEAGFVEAKIYAKDKHRVSYEKLRQEYQLWATEKGFLEIPESNALSKSLYKAIKAKNNITQGKSNGKRYIEGIDIMK
ncbi:DNA primase family protein [Anaerosporobacter sp.]